MASPIFFSLYLDDLFIILKNSGLGCRIGPHFFGVEGYADDCALLSPDREGLQKMLDICKKYFDKIKIKISTNEKIEKTKTKCIAFGCNDPNIKHITLEGRNFPWVESWAHLVHLLHKDESLGHDLLLKRGQFIGKLH